MNYAIWNLNNRPHRGKRRKKRKTASILTGSETSLESKFKISSSFDASFEVNSKPSFKTSSESSSGSKFIKTHKDSSKVSSKVSSKCSSIASSKASLQSYSTENQMDRKPNLLTCVLKNIERKFIKDDKKDDVKYIISKVDIDDKFKDEETTIDLKCNDIKRSRRKKSGTNESISNVNGWWVFDRRRRWTIIFLFTFIIQLTYITSIEALEHSTRNLIRFTIDHHSTYFNDLYTTPNYNLFYNTNSLSSSGNDHIRTTKSSKNEDGTFSTSYGTTSRTSERIMNSRSLTTASARSVRSSTRTINKASRILEENNENVQNELTRSKIEKLNEINNRIEHIDHLVDAQQTASLELTTVAISTTNTVTSSKLSSSRLANTATTRRTLNANKNIMKNIKDEKQKLTNKNLTRNKKIQSIKFNNQNYQNNKKTPSWFQKQPPKYQQIYKTDLKPIDFEFNQLENRTLNLKASHVLNDQMNKTTYSAMKRLNVVNIVNNNENLDKFNNLEHFRTTTRIFIPFKSTFSSTLSDLDILETIDYNEKKYLNKSIYLLTTTKLPRIKKNLKDEQIYFTNNLRFDKQTTPLSLVKLDSPFNSSKDSQDLNQIDQISEANQTISNTVEKTTEFSGNGIIYSSFNKNSTARNESFNDLNYFNETINDSPFLIWLGSYIAHPTYVKVIIIFAQLICLIFTIVGNVLVIISIFTYNPLRNVQNMFLVSLAVSDITVAVCILPLNMAYYLVGKSKIIVLKKIDY